VVQLALETTLSALGSYFPSFTPITNMGASAEGAEMMTFFAPALMCAWHCRGKETQGRTEHNHVNGLYYIAEGAEMMNFFAPALMCAWHCRGDREARQNRAQPCLVCE
jgi:hypothetical protein